MQDFSERKIIKKVEMWLSKLQTITPFAAEQYPAVFINPQTDILTVTPKRNILKSIHVRQ